VHVVILSLSNSSEHLKLYLHPHANTGGSRERRISAIVSRYYLVAAEILRD